MTFRGQRSRSNHENFEVEYLENGARQRDVIYRSQIESHICVFLWYSKFRHQMTFRGQSSRSNPKHFEVEYIENGTKEMVSIEVK